MRVALVDPSLFTLPYDRGLAVGLAAAGHDVVLHGRRLGPNDGGADDVALSPSFYRLAGTRPVAALPAPLRLAIKGLDHAWSLARLRRRLGAEAPDVIHFQWLPLPVVDRRLLGGFRALAPMVLTVHDTDPFNGSPTAAVQRLGVTEAFKAFDRLIVHTAQGRERLLAHGLAPERIAVVPHGITTRAPATLAPSRLDGEITFLLFGKMKPYKGIDVLIEAFAMLPEALRSRALVRVVGKPYMDIEPLRALARERHVGDRVVLEPRFVADDEIPALFAPDTVAVFPYREIEASGVLSQAIENGRPVIASRLGNLAEAIRDGVDGCLVPPGDAPALAAALGRFAADRAFAASCAASVREMAATLGERAGGVLPWNEVGRRTAALYREIGAARTG
jgi:glycosyltransferase involved in cell wall biosynthesis